jgi:hypothetical protein
MKEYTVTSDQKDAHSQLDSTLQQLRDRAKSSPAWTIHTVPIADDNGNQIGLSSTINVRFPATKSPG